MDPRAMFKNKLAILLAGSLSASSSALSPSTLCYCIVYIHVYMYTYNDPCQKLSLRCPLQLNTRSFSASQHVHD